MKTVLEVNGHNVIGEDISGYCIKVYIEDKKYLGKVIMYKDVKDLLPNELEEVGKMILGREYEEEFGTFVLLDGKLMLKDRIDLGYYEVKDPSTIKNDLYRIYCELWKKPLEQEQKRLEKLEKSKETVKSYALI